MNKIIYFAAFFILFAVSVYSQNLESLNNKFSLLSQNLEFIENKGQIADQHGNVNWDVLFIAEVENGTIAIRKDGISFTFVKYDKVPSLKKDAKDKIQGLRDKFQEPEPVNVDMYRVDMNLNNAQIPTRITKKEMTEDYNNYYLAHCPDGVTFVRKYRTVVLENVYQNIDLVLYSNQENKFQYDFVLKPGANPDLISLRFDGAEDVQISAKGELIVKTPFGNIEQKAPVAYQKDDLNKYTNSRILTNNIEIVKSKFRKNKDNSISFIVANYNPEKALIIDPPTRLWGTYYGGSGDDAGKFVAVDGSRNVYLGGWTYSTNAIATTGSHQSSKGDYYDAFLVKFNSSGVRQWGTYYGGSNWDLGRSVAVDGSWNVYLGGSTGSTNAIATTGSHQSSFGGGDWDAFLVKFIDKTTSVEETSKIEKIRIIPNPATYYITISSPLIEWSGLFGSPLAEGQGVFIYNTLGNCVSHTPSLRATLLKEGNIRIDVSHLPPGVYFVRIGTATGMFVKM